MARVSVNLKRALLTSALAIGAAVLAASVHIARPHAVANKIMPSAPSAPALAVPVLWNAPAFSFVSQTRQTITNRDLVGHVWIADFIFTQCTSACPLLTAKLVLLQQRLANPALRFVSFSVDPAHDTPEVLAKYAAVWRSDGQRWLLLSTDPVGLAAVARGLHVAVEETGDPKTPIAHTAQFFLVDARGNVRGFYASDDAVALARLVDDATALVPSASPVSTAAQSSGARLYAELGCDGCHARPELAPPLSGIAGQSVLLDDGVRVTVNSAYIRDSIAHPNASLVAGYGRLMPEYGNSLSGQEIMQLAEYVESLRGPPTTAPSAAVTSDSRVVLQIDPVCGMTVRVTAATPTANYAGLQYSFCSDVCRQRFEKAPDGYVKK